MLGRPEGIHILRPFIDSEQCTQAFERKKYPHHPTEKAQGTMNFKKTLSFSAKEFFTVTLMAMQHALFAAFIVFAISALSMMGLANPVTVIAFLTLLFWMKDELSKRFVVEESLYDEVHRHIEQAGIDGITIDDLAHVTDIDKGDVSALAGDLVKAQKVKFIKDKLVLNV